MFVWIDLEMTGLNPRTDAILEIATIITDADLNVLYRGPDLVIYQSPDVLAQMMPVVREMHTRSNLIEQVSASNISLERAERETLAFIKQHVVKGRGFLAGNSIWQDRAFLAIHMPSILDYLHYRLLDVTALKLVINSWYPNQRNAGFKKNETHRALDDIQESIEELKFYKKNFFV